MNCVNRIHSVAALMACLFAVGAFGQTNSPYPAEKKVEYTDGHGHARVYLVQEPTHGDTNGIIVIYLHGAAGKEEQGMNIFPTLRALVEEKGWIYVCPRDNEFSGLCRDLKQRYGQRPLLLAGASAGGYGVFEETLHNASRYCGLILLCPATYADYIDESDARILVKPVWIVVGEKDSIAVDASRKLNRILVAAGRPVSYHELPGGDHNTPLTAIDWQAAIKFIVENQNLSKQ